MHDPLYVSEKLGNAVYELAVGRGPVKERLQAAAIAFHSLTPADFPEDEDLRMRFSAIWDRLTAMEPEGNEGRIAASIRRMSDDDAVEIAREVVEIEAFQRSLTTARD